MKKIQLQPLLLCGFAILGDPNENESLKRIKKYIENGVDMLELAVPFSDATGDGPVIQAGNERAIKNGMTIKKALQMVKKIRSWTNMPIGLMTYDNIPVHYGIEKFYRDTKKAGGTSILIVDVPLEEIGPFVKQAKKYCLNQIMLITENTDKKRLKKIEKIVRSSGNGFLYAVSTLGVTGIRKNFHQNTMNFLKKIKKNASLKVMAGFGISKISHIKKLRATEIHGVIIGSKLVKTKTENLEKTLQNFKKACII